MSNSTTTATSSSVQSSLSSSISSSLASESSSIVASVSSQISSNADSTTTVLPSSTHYVTSVVSASSAPASTELITSVVTQSPSSAGQSTLPAITVVETLTPTAKTTTASIGTSSSSTSASASSTSSSAASLNSQNNGTNNSSGGLSSAGKTAIAVVVPVVVVALLVLAGLFFWRKRKQRKNAEEARRLEVEEYGFNPNSDPTLPAVAADGSEMAEDHSSGYRGWGTTPLSNRKASTTISGGYTQGQLSDSGSNPGYSSSPNGAGSDTQSGDALVGRRETMNSDDLGALGVAPAASSNRQDNIRRGPSNASSSYSAGNRSDHSDPIGQAYGEPYNPSASYGSYHQPGPYGDGSYGPGDGMPVVRDVTARRNTRIEQGGGYQQGNSGIAQNF